MVASSVTGVGPGESNGKQKYELHSGCGCCGSSSSSSSTAPAKRGCVVKLSSGGRASYRSNSSSVKNGSCF